jgi:hypothetical protein
MPQELEQWSMWISDMEHEGPLPRNTTYGDAGNGWEHPASGGVLYRLPCVVWEGGWEVYEPLPDAIVQGRIDAQAHGHDH